MSELLAVKEFTFGHNLVGSDGDVISEFESIEYAAIFDTEKVSEEDVDSYIKEVVSMSAEKRLDIIVMPKETWDALRRMITDNYVLIDKNAAK